MTKKSKESKEEKKTGKKSRYMLKTANITIDVASATVSTVIKLIGTLLLILLVTA